MKKGFTLIEMVAYIGILSIIVLASSAFLIWLIQFNVKLKASSEALHYSERIIQIISYEIKESEEVLSVISNRISIRRKNGDEISFFVCNSNLCLQENQNEPIFLTSGNIKLDNINFTEIRFRERRSININIGIRYQGPSERPEHTALVIKSTSISPRSY